MFLISGDGELLSALDSEDYTLSDDNSLDDVFYSTFKTIHFFVIYFNSEIVYCVSINILQQYLRVFCIFLLFDSCFLIENRVFALRKGNTYSGVMPETEFDVEV